MNQYEQYYLFVTSFVLCTAAAATRLLKLSVRPVCVRQVLWTSLHAGFAGLATTLIMRGYNASNAITILGISLFAALSGAEINTLAQSFGASAIKKVFDAMPPGGGGGKDGLDFGPPDAGGVRGGAPGGDPGGGGNGGRGTGP
jgi:hypothetical protein